MMKPTHTKLSYKNVQNYCSLENERWKFCEENVALTNDDNIFPNLLLYLALGSELLQVFFSFS